MNASRATIVTPTPELQLYQPVYPGATTPTEGLSLMNRPFHRTADEPSTLPALASNARPDWSIIAGSADGPPAFVGLRAGARALSAMLP